VLEKRHEKSDAEKESRSELVEDGSLGKGAR